MAKLTLAPPYNRWGSITLTGINEELRKITDGAITETFYDTLYSMTCDCGKELQIYASDFPGKKAVMDCGCGEGRRVKEARHTSTFYCDVSIINQIKTYAYHQHISYSKACVELLTVGLSSLDGIDLGDGR